MEISGHELEVAQIGDTAAESSYTIGRLNTGSGDDDILNLKNHDDNLNLQKRLSSASSSRLSPEYQSARNDAFDKETNRQRHASESSQGSQK